MRQILAWTSNEIHRRKIKQSRNERIGLLLGLTEFKILGGKSLEVHGVQYFNQWLELPDEITDWLTQEQTVLLAKTEDLSNDRSYRPITCLNTCYKIFTGMIGNFMKEHAERNNIWE